MFVAALTLFQATGHQEPCNDVGYQSQVERTPIECDGAFEFKWNLLTHWATLHYVVLKNLIRNHYYKQICDHGHNIPMLLGFCSKKIWIGYIVLVVKYWN